jgi:hypothetical protein
MDASSFVPIVVCYFFAIFGVAIYSLHLATRYKKGELSKAKLALEIIVLLVLVVMLIVGALYMFRP